MRPVIADFRCHAASSKKAQISDEWSVTMCNSFLDRDRRERCSRRRSSFENLRRLPAAPEEDTVQMKAPRQQTFIFDLPIKMGLVGIEINHYPSSASLRSDEGAPSNPLISSEGIAIASSITLRRLRTAALKLSATTRGPATKTQRFPLSATVPSAPNVPSAIIELAAKKHKTHIAGLGLCQCIAVAIRHSFGAVQRSALG